MIKQRATKQPVPASRCSGIGSIDKTGGYESGFASRVLARLIKYAVS